jgi:hypothetical protein
MIQLSIKSAIYYMFCLLLSTLGFVEFEDLWKPGEHALNTRNEQTEAFSSLQMTSRKASEFQTAHFFDLKTNPIQHIPKRDFYSDVFQCQPSGQCKYFIVIEELKVETQVYSDEADIEFVYLISR